MGRLKQYKMDLMLVTVNFISDTVRQPEEAKWEDLLMTIKGGLKGKCLPLAKK